jgi:hypothetical protein
MTPIDFRALLARQLCFVEKSCQAFDAGFHDEAIRIAQCIHVIVHDTTTHTSVLTHLNARNIVLTSTCRDIAKKVRQFGGQGGMQFYSGMGMFEVGAQGARYSPKLDNHLSHHQLPVEEWWREPVFVQDPDYVGIAPRRDVVVNASDSDCRAHVDAALTPMFESLVNCWGPLGVFVDLGETMRVTGHYYVALRQMGHELLQSPHLIDLAK